MTTVVNHKGIYMVPLAFGCFLDVTALGTKFCVVVFIHFIFLLRRSFLCLLSLGIVISEEVRDQQI